MKSYEICAFIGQKYDGLFKPYKFKYLNHEGVILNGVGIKLFGFFGIYVCSRTDTM